MAQTTNAVNACNVVLTVDDSTGTPVDISGSANNASLDFTVQSSETFTFDGDWAIKKSCKKSASLSINVLYTLNDAEGSNIMEDWFHNSSGISRTVQIEVPSSAGGGFSYSGEWTIEGYGLPVTADDAAVIMMGFSLSNDGAVTRAAIAS